MVDGYVADAPSLSADIETEDVMRTIALLTILIATAMSGMADDTNSLTRTEPDTVLRFIKVGRSLHPLMLAEGDQQRPVFVMEPLKSDSVTKLFPHVTSFRLISSSDIIHRARFSALLIDTNGSPSHLQSDEQVAEFLGVLSRKIKTETDAKLLIQAFADLRSYRIAQERPNAQEPRMPDTIPTPLPTDYKFFVENRDREWRVYATLFTSDYSSSFMRYTFTIYKDPGSGIHFEKPVLIRLGNHVY